MLGSFTLLPTEHADARAKRASALRHRGDLVQVVALTALGAGLIAQISCGECERCRAGLTKSCSVVPPNSMLRHDKGGGAEEEADGGRSEPERIACVQGQDGSQTSGRKKH